MMNNTIESLASLKLFGMAAELERQIANPSSDALSFELRIRSMVDHEMTLRNNKRLQLLLKKAQLPFGSACVEDLDYRSVRGLDKSEMLSLTTMNWVTAGHNLVITGPTGTGKSWIASALGNQACRMGLTCLFTRVRTLMEELLVSHASGLFNQKIERYRKYDLLILDDWGMEPFAPRAQYDLLEIIESRHGARATIFTSQVPMDQWHDLMDNKTVADALMDRVINSSNSMKLFGESLRRQKSQTIKTAPTMKKTPPLKKTSVAKKVSGTTRAKKSA